MKKNGLAKWEVDFHIVFFVFHSTQETLFSILFLFFFIFLFSFPSFCPSGEGETLPVDAGKREGSKFK